MAASAAWAQMLKKNSLDQAFRGSNGRKTEHQSSMMMNWLLLPKNRADVYVVTAESKQAVMVVQYTVVALFSRRLLSACRYLHPCSGVLATSQRRPFLLSLPSSSCLSFHRDRSGTPATFRKYV